MRRLNIDIETYSSVDLTKSGLYKYAEADDFEILLFAYSIDGGQEVVVDIKNGEAIPADVIQLLLDDTTEKRAYNAAFEYYCLKMAGYSTNLATWRCTMAQALYAGYTAGLGQTAEALGLPQDKQKLTTGRALIRKFCVPRKPTARDARTRILPQDEPEKWELFKEYCIRDVVVERAVADKLERYQLPDIEQKLWIIDVEMNERGIQVDPDLIHNAIAIADQVEAEQIQEARDLTGLENPKSTAQLKGWLEETLPADLLNADGSLDSVCKKTIGDLQDQVDPDGEIARLLQLKREISKTSNKKYDAMDNCITRDNRVKGLLQYYGANRTGRWAGRLVQVQNLPKNKMATLDLARQLAKAGDLHGLRWIYGNVPDALSQLIRTAFIPTPGNTFLVADYSAIEARVIAWLAGEDWRLEVFKTHGKIYEASASAMFDVPLEHIVRGRPEYALRQKGKVAELALGYGGSKGALAAMGALDMGLTEEELPDIVNRWRKANPAITGLWRTLEDAAMGVMTDGAPRRLMYNLTIHREMDLAKGLDYLIVTLPSGRQLFYAQPHIVNNRFDRQAIAYMGMDQVKRRWTQQETYGGKLTENIIQAIARDCLAAAIINTQARGYDIVMHIHDEIVVDAPAGTELEKITDIMAEPIDWAPGLILRGDGYETPYYKKD